MTNVKSHHLTYSVKLSGSVTHWSYAWSALSDKFHHSFKNDPPCLHASADFESGVEPCVPCHWAARNHMALGRRSPKGAAERSGSPEPTWSAAPPQPLSHHPRLALGRSCCCPVPLSPPPPAGMPAWWGVERTRAATHCRPQCLHRAPGF